MCRLLSLPIHWHSLLDLCNTVWKMLSIKFWTDDGKMPFLHSGSINLTYKFCRMKGWVPRKVLVVVKLQIYSLLIKISLSRKHNLARSTYFHLKEMLISEDQAEFLHPILNCNCLLSFKVGCCLLYHYHYFKNIIKMFWLCTITLFGPARNSFSMLFCCISSFRKLFFKEKAWLFFYFTSQVSESAGIHLKYALLAM